LDLSMRIYALSDVHVDYAPNREWLRKLASAGHQEDTLLLAGDVTDDMGRLEETFRTLKEGFRHVFFVPGNHELWLRRGGWVDSLEKFEAILELCRSYRVFTEPVCLGGETGVRDGKDAVWVVPLFSWYMEPQEGAASLFVPKRGEDPTLANWSDKYFVRWPWELAQEPPALRFLAMNEGRVHRAYSAPVISFSHFLPRRELMYSPRPLAESDPHPEFNFSRVAGCSALDDQIRRLGSRVHVYGHQHRNRDLTLDGVRYVSHCRGYPLERARGYLWEDPELKVVWNSESWRKERETVRALPQGMPESLTAVATKRTL
jgi:predicted phosphodiesterase